MSGQADKNSRIWDDIEAGRFKAAHKTCVRRIEKGETSDYLQVLRAHTLSLYASATLSATGDSYKTGRADFIEATKLAKRLASRPVPFSDVDALRLLHRVCDAQKLEPALISGALERAAKAKPKDLKLALEWFNGCVKAGNWKGAQSAAMVLQKTWVGERKYFFWAAASSWLLAKTHAEDSMERKLFATLAYKMITKARNDTPLDTKVIPARAIQTAQEIHLLVSIVRDYGTDKTAALREALAILESSNLGVNSEIGKGDWWGLVRLQLDILEELGEWTKERELCKELLAKSIKDVKPDGKTGKGDDWRVWEGLFKATEEQLKADDSGEFAEKLLADTRDVIERHMEVDKKSRNILLANCFYARLADSRDEEKRTGEAPELLEKLQRYFEQWGTKNCCFEDTRAFTELLGEMAQAAFLKFVAERVKKLKEEANDLKTKVAAVAAETNKLKFEYLLTLSVAIPKEKKAEDSSKETLEKLEGFAENCLRLYTEALSLGSGLLETDDQHGDEAGILAVMALTRAYHTSNYSTPEHVYKALFHLDNMLDKSPHNYQAMLFAVSLSILIGAPSLALQYVPDLNIKQVQLDTLTHYYLTRISSLLPVALPSRQGIDTDVTTFLTRLEKFYQKAIFQTGDMQVFALDRGTYNQCSGFLEFHRRLKNSLTRILTQIEHRRIDRFRRAPQGNVAFAPHVDAIDPAEFPAEPSDNRDFKVISNFENSKLPSFHTAFLALGPAPTIESARAFSTIENLIDSLLGPAPPALSETISPALLRAKDSFASDFTKPELAHLSIAAQTSLAAATQSKESLSTLEASISALKPTKSGSLGFQLHERNELLHACTLLKLLVNNFESSAKLRKKVNGVNKQLTEVVRGILGWNEVEVGGAEKVMLEKLVGRWGEEEGVERFVERVEMERRTCWASGEVGWGWVAVPKK